MRPSPKKTLAQARNVRGETDAVHLALPSEKTPMMNWHGLGFVHASLASLWGLEQDGLVDSAPAFNLVRSHEIANDLVA